MGQKRKKRTRSAAVATAAAAASILMTGTPAQALPGNSGSADAAAGAVGIHQVSATRAVLNVFSPSMNRVISNEVLHSPEGGPAPTLVLLNGALGNEDGVGWLNNSGVEQFFLDKNVTVVA
ncbi:MAG: hypothetical protein ACK40J_16635, partial [Rhodococcus sp. (in: high G+C Gram-positive bacteria)]